MKTEIKYKVTSGANRSVMVDGLACIMYMLGEYVTSPDWLRDRGYYPFVFSDIWSAKRFISQNPFKVLHIFRAQVKGHHRKKQLPERFYNASLAHGVCRPVPMVFPEGTEMWEFIKLLEKIK